MQPRNEEPTNGENFDGCLTIQSMQQSSLRMHTDTHKRTYREVKHARSSWKKTATEMDHSESADQQQLSTAAQPLPIETASITFTAPASTPFIPPTACTMERLHPLSPSSPYGMSAQGSPGNTHSPLLQQHYSPHTSAQVHPSTTFIATADYAALSPHTHTQMASGQMYPHSPEQIMVVSPGQYISKVPSPANTQYNHSSPYIEAASTGDMPAYIPNHPPPRYEDSVASMNGGTVGSMHHHLLTAEATLPNYSFQSHTTPSTSQY